MRFLTRTAILILWVNLLAALPDAMAQVRSGTGMPPGGSIGDCVVNTAPGVGEWAVCPGGGAVATDAIWDVAGDLAVGSGADTAVRLAKGNDGDVLTISGGSVAWGAASASGMTHPQVMVRASIGF